MSGTRTPQSAPSGERGQPSLSPPAQNAVERDLRERVKELSCLYAISRLAQQKDISLAELAREVVGLLCESWQFPELATARVELAGHSHASADFRRTRWRQTRVVRVHGEAEGRIEICYLKRPPGLSRTGSAFLDEETHLLQAVAENLGRIIEARQAEEHLQNLSRELMRAQEMERQRIARELHDDVAQSLSMLKIGLESLDADGAPALRQQVKDLSAHVGGVIESVRRLSYALLPPGLVQLGLVSTLFRLCEDFSVRQDIPVDFRAEGMDGVKPDFEFQINIYRILQEALTNVRRHARATRVDVKLIASHPSVLLRIEDDGQGFAPEPCHGEALRERHMGLWSMGERARLLGGTLRIRTAPGKGTRILVDIPELETGMTGCRIMIVDDHSLFREGLRALVQRNGNYEVVAEAGTCAAAMELAREKKPDVAIVDIGLPDCSGIELLHKLRSMLPGLAVVVVSMHSKIEFIAESFRAGAGAYVLKESTADRLVQALEAVRRQEQYLDSAVSPKVLQKLLEFSNRRSMISDSPYSQLTKREQQIFRLLAEGVHPGDIAAQLFISRKTVDNHRANIMGKLGLSSPVELVRYAARLGVVDLDT